MFLLVTDFLRSRGPASGTSVQPEPDEDKMKNLLCLMACLLVVACSSENQEAETAESPEQTTDAMEQIAEQSKSALDDKAVDLAVRNVRCGCKVEGIGKRGNYFEIGSYYVEIANREALGLENKPRSEERGLCI